jgi:hypothetical protein
MPDNLLYYSRRLREDAFASYEGLVPGCATVKSRRPEKIRSISAMCESESDGYR